MSAAAPLPMLGILLLVGVPIAAGCFYLGVRALMVGIEQTPRAPFPVARIHNACTTDAARVLGRYVFEVGSIILGRLTRIAFGLFFISVPVTVLVLGAYQSLAIKP